MHYQFFTSSDSITIVAICLAIYLFIQFILRRKQLPIFDGKTILISVVIGILATLLSTLFYEELFGHKGSVDVSYIAKGYPRYIYKVLVSDVNNASAKDLEFFFRHFTENTAIYSSVALVIISLFRVFKKA